MGWLSRLFDKEERYEYRADKYAAKAAANEAKLEVLTGEAEAEASAPVEEEVEAELVDPLTGKTSKVPMKLKRKGGKGQPKQQQLQQAQRQALADLEARISELEEGTHGLVKGLDRRQRGRAELGAKAYAMVQGLVAVANVGDTPVNGWALAGSKVINMYLIASVLDVSAARSGPATVNPEEAMRAQGRRGEEGLEEDTIQWMLVVSTLLYLYAYYDPTVGWSSIFTNDSGTSLFGVTATSGRSSTITLPALL